jgi:hypothetical protein
MDLVYFAVVVPREGQSPRLGEAEPYTVLTDGRPRVTPMLVRKDNVLVVIPSKLNDPGDRAQFLKLSKLTEQLLVRQPGFLRYELYETAVGWFDTMLWQDKASSDAGNAAFAETDIVVREVSGPG